MNTETAAPANLTVAQLGQVLAKSNAGKTASPDPKTPATPAAPVTSREPLPPEDGPEATEAAPDLSQTADAEENAPETETQATADDADDAAQTKPEAEPDGGDTSLQTDTETPSAPQLPKELADAIEIAKGDGKKGVAQLLQRVNKLVDQRDTERNKRLELEAAKTELETELETARGQKSEDRSQRTDQSHPAVAKVNAALAEVDGFIRLFRANPHGVEIPDGQGGTTQLDADAVAEHLDQLRDKRTELLTERKLTEQTVKERFAQQHAQSHALAVKVYPWLTKPDAPEQARMKQLLQVLPSLKELPDYELVIGHYVRGEAAALAEAKAKGQKPVTQKAPPSREPTKLVTEAPGSKAGPADAKATAIKAVKAADARFKETGKREDLQRLESAKQRLKHIS